MSRLIVLDCSVTAAWFLPDESSAAAQRILDDIMNHTSSLIVPSLWYYEITNVVRSSVRRKRIDQSTANAALFLLREVPKEVIDPEKQGPSGMLAMAIDHDLSAYDAAYLYLAETAGADLFTADEDLLALGGKFTFVKKPEEY